MLFYLRNFMIFLRSFLQFYFTFTIFLYQPKNYLLYIRSNLNIHMKKTEQTANKTSFRGLINIDNEKLPEKKSRSRSIRDRNNTTNQFSISRATQHNDKSINCENTNGFRQNALITTENRRKYSEDYDNVFQKKSNVNKKQSSIEKIRENMRKQSTELKQRQRNRSHSRRRKSSNEKRNTCHTNHVNKFAIKPKDNNSINSQNQGEQVGEISQEQVINQVINLKNQINSLQKSYRSVHNKINPSNQNNSLNLLNYSSPQMIMKQKEEELKQKAQDLNNILETFHITFKENVNKTTKELFTKIDNTQAKLSLPANLNDKAKIGQDDEQNKLDFIINNIDVQFGIGGNQGYHGSFLQHLRSENRASFSDLQNRLLLTERRLLRQ